MKRQYQHLEQQIAINRQTSDIARQFTENYFEEGTTRENKEKKSKSDIKKSKVDMKLLTPTVPGDDSAYSNEIGRALEISEQKIVIDPVEDIKISFREKVKLLLICFL